MMKDMCGDNFSRPFGTDVVVRFCAPGDESPGYSRVSLRGFLFQDDGEKHRVSDATIVPHQFIDGVYSNPSNKCPVGTFEKLNDSRNAWPTLTPAF